MKKSLSTTSSHNNNHKNHKNKRSQKAVSGGSDAIYNNQMPSDQERSIIVNLNVQRKLDFYHSVFPDNRLWTDVELGEICEHFEEHGWAIAKQLIPNSMCDNLIQQMNQLMIRYSGFDIYKPSTWHFFPFKLNGFVELYHLHAQYEMRFYPRLYQLFTVLYEDEKLRVLIDRNCCKRSCYRPLMDDQSYNVFLKQQATSSSSSSSNTSNTSCLLVPEWRSKGFWHHDMNLITGYAPNPVQCVIALADNDESQGGFQCIDKFHWIAEQWATQHNNESYKNKLSHQPDKIPIHVPKEDEEWVKRIGIHPSMNQGDVMVWKSQVCHGSGSNENRNGLPRLATYVNYVPVSHESVSSRIQQIQSFESGCHPESHLCDLRWQRIEQENHVPFTLRTELEERLIGLSEYY